MMLPWMLYAAALAVLALVAGLALERIAGQLGLPRRGIWAGMLALSLLAPLAVLATPPSVDAAGLHAGVIGAVQGEGAFPSAAPAREERLLERLHEVGPLLLPLWGTISAGLLLYGLAAAVRLRRERRSWRGGRVCGERVWLARRTGPAVVGVLDPEIVLPERVLDWTPEAQRLVIEHEREHIRAADPRLLALGWLAVVLVPWNPALWWQLSRLRTAVEVDCDARVLRRRPDVRLYGTLLLEVGRLASSGRLPLAAFAEPRSTLERRIRAMTQQPRASFGTLAGFALLVAAAGIAACTMPVPAEPDDRAARVLDAEPQPVRTSVASMDTTPPTLRNAAGVASALQAAYPASLRETGKEGTALVEIHIDSTGRVVSTRALQSTHPLFAEAAVTVLRQARFAPAMWQGTPVGSHWRVPVAFQDPAAPRAAPAAADTSPPRFQYAAAVRAAVEAAYPSSLRGTGKRGSVLVEIHIDSAGRVESLRALESTDPLFADAAVAALREARFVPATSQGRPIASHWRIPVSFEDPALGGTPR